MDKTLLRSLKKFVVNIEQNVSQPLNSEKSGVFAGTGFIVDSKLGIIVSNFHIVGSSPQQVKITFENGESCDAVTLHYDA
jgi:S1-C subfamily serine protease